MTGGRPLRFLAVVIAVWASARGVAIYREGVGAVPVTIAPVQRVIAALTRSFVADALPLPSLPIGIAFPAQGARSSKAAVPAPTTRTSEAAAALPRAAAMIAGPSAYQDRIPAPRPAPVVWVPSASGTIPHGASRLAGSAWLIARNGVPAGVSGSQLGASQAGMRVTYALGTARRVAIAARVSAPLSGRGREASLGLDWQPTRAPIHVIAEQRVALDGGRGGPTLSLVGGFGPTEVAPGLRLEGYGQAGVIVRDGGEGFADGALRASHAVGRIGPLSLDLGVGLWGGAQRGATRLDVGPSLGVGVPVGRRTIRLAADWRERIAGQARPDSGPALSIGTDF